MVIISVLEPALTVSPTVMATDTTVPLIGLVSVASLSDCCASVRFAAAVSIAAWSDAICSGVSVLLDPPLPWLLDPLLGLLLAFEGLPEPVPVPVLPLVPVLPVLPVPVPVLASMACPPTDPEFPVEPDPLDDSAARAWARAVSSLETVV